MGIQTHIHKQTVCFHQHSWVKQSKLERLEGWRWTNG